MVNVIKGEVLIEEGYSISVAIMPIIAGVEVVVFDGKEAVLRINELDAVEFNWTEESAAMFADIDVCEVIELLELLQRTQIR